KLPVPDLENNAGEIRHLYLRATVQRGGLGTRLLVTMLDWLAAQGYSPLYVGVWSGNLGAQRLYGRFGFEKIGEYDFPVGNHLDREFILRQQKGTAAG
ncbi:MAG: GNAT family N-acetyltransferase, partial [Gammaproteobacteria bacterium]|nr:GNAT family N-acetyltransferase [Gammaproteobacteria bacterium]